MQSLHASCNTLDQYTKDSKNYWYIHNAVTFFNMTYFKVKDQTEYSNNVSAIQKQLNNILKVLLRMCEKI